MPAPITIGVQCSISLILFIDVISCECPAWASWFNMFRVYHSGYAWLGWEVNVFVLARVEGFEPPITGPEPVALPLGHTLSLQDKYIKPNPQ